MNYGTLSAALKKRVVFACAQKEILVGFVLEILGDEWYNQADLGFKQMII